MIRPPEPQRHRLRRLLLLGGLGLAALSTKACSRVLADRAEAREAEAERRYPPPGRDTLVNGKRVYADIRGRGRDLVLIHGASGNSRDFTFALADRLAGLGFRVTSFDRPGLGWSDDLGDAGVSPLAQAAHLMGAARQFGLRRPIVLGQSYGGAVAMAWALTDPGYTAAIVSVSGATNVWPGGLGALTALTSGPLGSAVIAPTVAAYATMDLAKGALEKTFAPDPIPPGYLEHIGVGLATRRRQFVENARQLDGLKRHLAVMEPAYGTLRMPLEIVFGAEDRTVWPSVHGEVLVRQVPGARLTVLPGAGHMPHHSQPDAVIAAITRARDRAGQR